MQKCDYNPRYVAPVSDAITGKEDMQTKIDDTVKPDILHVKAKNGLLEKYCLIWD